MSTKEKIPNPPFRYMVRATGQAEVWTNTTDQFKMNEYGWRCHTNENSYELETLMGNWCEERSDIEQRKKPECLPSQFGHYFQSVYDSSFNTVPKYTVPQELRNLKERHPHSYPHHQPELDSESLKAIYNSWETTQRASYLDPRFRKHPIIFYDKNVDSYAANPLAPGVSTYISE